MCGIVGFTGSEAAVPILLEGLTRLEYRGYDSAGIAVTENGGITVVKEHGRLDALKRRVAAGEAIESSCGIGHTRWATHGEPNYINAHPHMTESGRIAVVHNGIIENYMELKDKLAAKGYTFRSETDTEVIANLVEYYYKGDILDAVIAAQNKMKGSYALGVLCVDRPDEIVAVRKDSPLVVAMTESGAAMASDIPALLRYTRDFYNLGEKELVVLSKDSLSFFDINKEPIRKSTYHVDWDAEAASKAGYEHFMMKELMEQPRALRDTILPNIRGGEVSFAAFAPTKDEILALDRLFIVACGSAAHAGIVGKYAIEKLARIPVEVELASEFRYKNPIISDKSLVLIISQSGTTADSLEALRYAKSKGAHTLAVVNVVGSQIAQEADSVIFTNAGPEIAVATTKAYSCQLSVMYMIAIHFGRALGLIGDDYNASLIGGLKDLPDLVSGILDRQADIQKLASRYYGAKNVFFIGRNMDYAAGLEASLKLKEISYIHSEAYAAGELKHGTLALIEESTPVVAIAVCRELFDKLLSNVVEVVARRGDVIALTWEGNTRVESVCGNVFYVPETLDVFTPTLTIIPLQLFAYYVASMKGLDIDKPRNLAKSVTVE